MIAEDQTDARLLERFASHREEAAFAALVRRHGPRVERICRRILRNEHDVEDVFQATFLVLSRKAAGIPWHDSVSPWIDSVARRLAMHARSGAVRHRVREVPVTALAGAGSDDVARLPERYHPVVEPSAEPERRDLRRVLDDELRRLPEKYRAPVVLCDLEGHTSQEAARQLGWPAGSMSRRLQRARSLLRRRLSHRGLTLAMIGLASAAIAAAAIGLGPGRSPRAAGVRQVMSAFRPIAEGGQGFGDVLAAAALGEGSPPDFSRIRPAAREAASAARQLEDHDAGRMAPLWNHYAGEMNHSALELDRACKESDSLALVAAARRLNASCLNCHAVFYRRSVGQGAQTDPASFRSSARESTGRLSSLHRVATVRTRVRLRPPDVHSLTLLAPIVTRPVASNEWTRAAVMVLPPRVRHTRTSGVPARRAGAARLDGLIDVVALSMNARLNRTPA